MSVLLISNVVFKLFPGDFLDFNVTWRLFEIKNQEGPRKTNLDLLWHLKSVLFDGFYDIFEEDFWSQCVSMIYYWFPILTVPTIELHTAAALLQSVNVGVYTGRTP